MLLVCYAGWEKNLTQPKVYAKSYGQYWNDNLSQGYNDAERSTARFFGGNGDKDFAQ
jgi:hypothetical protein